VADRPATPHQLDPQTVSVARTLEGYVAASAPPRWMERLSQIDTGTERTCGQLAAAHRHAWEATAR
jgi:hypothetical protein